MLVGVRSSDACVFIGGANYLLLDFLSITFCNALFVDRYCLNLVFHGKTFFSVHGD